MPRGPSYPCRGVSGLLRKGPASARVGNLGPHARSIANFRESRHDDPLKRGSFLRFAVNLAVASFVLNLTTILRKSCGSMRLDGLARCGRRAGHRVSNGTMGGLAVPLQSLVLLTVLAAGLTSCSREVEYTDQQRACIASRYTNYDARQISQCVDVCRACMRGNVVTCNTSCRLRGAS